MIDTVALVSPPISDEVRERVQYFCTKRVAYEISTGELYYEFTTADLRDSADNRISIRVSDNVWVKNPGDKTAHKVNSAWYIRVECSVHKQMLGHNCFGGSSDFQLCVKWLVRRLETLLDVILPDYLSWRVNRLDFAEVYNLGSPEAVKDWFRMMNNCEYSRREESVRRFGCTGLYFPGSSTTLKFYHKGSEFRKHDRKKCKKLLTFQQLERLQDMADSLLRIEVEIHSRKLKYDFGVEPFVSQITTEYLINLFDAEVFKVLKGFGDDMKYARKSDDVEKVLYENYSPLLAGKLLGTWYRLSTKGESSLKDKMPERTLRRHKKLLLEAGCTWIGSDVVICESSVPVDFQPVRTDRHYFGYCLQEVQEMLNKIA